MLQLATQIKGSRRHLRRYDQIDVALIERIDEVNKAQCAVALFVAELRDPCQKDRVEAAGNFDVVARAPGRFAQAGKIEPGDSIRRPQRIHAAPRNLENR